MINLYRLTETNFDNNGLGSLDRYVLNPVIEEYLNGEYTFTFEYLINAPYSENLVHGAVLRAPTPNGNQLFRISNIRKSMGKISVLAYHIFYDLANNFIVDTNIVNKSPISWLEQIKRNMQFETNFTFFSDIEGSDSARIIRKNIVEILLDESSENSFISRFQGEILRDNFSVYFNKSIGSDKNFKIKYRKNLKGYEADIDYTNIATRIMPIGFDGLLLPEKFVDSPRINNYPHPKIAKVEFKEVIAAVGENKDKEGAVSLDEAYYKLRTLTKELFGKIDIPKTSYKVDFIDLSKTKEYKSLNNLQRVELGDIVEVEHIDDNFYVKSKVIAYKYDPIMKKFIEISLGNYTPSFNEVFNKIRDISKDIKKIESNTNKIQRAANGANKINRGIQEPENANPGDLWYKPSDNGIILHQWNGLSWEVIPISDQNLGNININNLSGNQAFLNFLNSLSIEANRIVVPGTERQLFSVDSTGTLNIDAEVKSKIRDGLATRDDIARIEINNERIKQSITSEVTKQTGEPLARVIENLNGLRNSIKGDGRNYFLNTKNFSGDWARGATWKSEPLEDGFTVKSTKGIWHGISQFVQSQADEWWTYSVDVRGEGIDHVNFYPTEREDRTKANLEEESIPISTEWKRISATFKTLTAGMIRPRIEKDTSAGKVYIKKIKLEKGTIATPWSPAPEDVDKALDSLPSLISTEVSNRRDELKGVGIDRLEEFYLVSPNSSGVTASTSGWSTSLPTMTATNKYLWTYEKTHLTDGTIRSTTPVIIGTFGRDGRDGRDGTDGTRITRVTNYYKATSQDSGVRETDSGWTTTTQPLTPTNKYLWNYENIEYSDNTFYKTEPHVVGVYGDKGEAGRDGVSVTRIEEFYLRSASNTGVTTSTSGWSSSISTPTETLKYLWKYERTHLSNGSTKETKPVILSTFVKDGKGILRIENFYLLNNLSTGVTTSSSGWSTSVKSTTSTNRYLWNYEKIYYTDGSHTTTLPVVIGTHGIQGATGPAGANGRNGADGHSVHIRYSNSSTGAGMTTSGVGKSYIGIRMAAATSVSSNPSDYTWTLIKGADGERGLPGRDGVNGKTSYLHIAYADDERGNGFSQNPTGKAYMGTYTDNLELDSSDKSRYSWARIKGERGDRGERGATGEAGRNGKNAFIRYTNFRKYENLLRGITLDNTRIADVREMQPLRVNKSTLPLEYTTYWKSNDFVEIPEDNPESVYSQTITIRTDGELYDTHLIDASFYAWKADGRHSHHRNNDNRIIRLDKNTWLLTSKTNNINKGSRIRVPDWYNIKLRNATYYEIVNIAFFEGDVFEGISTEGGELIGTYNGDSETAPTAFGDYTWSLFKGKDGEDYEGSNLLINPSLKLPATTKYKNTDYIKAVGDGTTVAVENGELIVTTTQAEAGFWWALERADNTVTKREYNGSHLTFNGAIKGSRSTKVKVFCDWGTPEAPKEALDVGTEYKVISTLVTSGGTGYNPYITMTFDNPGTYRLKLCSVQNLGAMQKILESEKKIKVFESNIDNFTSQIGTVSTILSMNLDNLCTETSATKTGNDLYFNLKETKVQGGKYTVFADISNAPPGKEAGVYNSEEYQNGKRPLKNGLNTWVFTSTNTSDTVNLHPLGANTTVKNVRVYKGDLSESSFATKEETAEIKSLIDQQKDKITLSVSEVDKIKTTINPGENLYVSQRGTDDKFFKTRVSMEANTYYTLVADLTGVPGEGNPSVRLYGIRPESKKQTIFNGKNVFLVSYSANKTEINIDLIPNNVNFTNVQIYKGDHRLAFDKEHIVTTRSIGTEIRQNAESVRIAWNQIAQNFQFEASGGNATLSIYNGAKSLKNLRSRFDEDGNHFYRDGKYLGRIGTNSLTNDDSVKGLTFNLEKAASYMSWSADDDDGGYTWKWTYINKYREGYTTKALNASCDIDLRGNYLRRAKLSTNCSVPVDAITGGVTHTYKFVWVRTVDDFGNPTSWLNNYYMTFKNGILIRSGQAE